MTYRRVRLAVLVVAALALLADPASRASTMSDHATAAARTLPAGMTVPDRAGKPGAPAGSPDATRSSAPATPPADPTRPPSAGSTPTGPARPPTPGVGPGGAAKRTGSAAVALTFDDGPDPVQTPAILDLLKQYGVKATFCLVGFRARNHPDLVRRIAAEGHTLCNHSWQHLFDLARRPNHYVEWDLATTNNVIRAAVPNAKIPYFRAPGGHFTPELVGLVAGYGMKSIYWDVDSRDWEHKGATDAAHIARVIAIVQRHTRPGAIVLSHDNKQPTTIEAYRTLLPWLKDRFQLIPLPT